MPTFNTNVPGLLFWSCILAEYVTYRVSKHHGRSWNLRKEFSRPGKSWKMTVVVDSHEKVVEFHQ